MNMKSIMAAAVAALLLVSSGVVHGVWTNRWSSTDGPRLAAANLKDIPLNVGNWTGTELEKSAEELAIAEAAGYSFRQYVHSRSRRTVTLLIVCGRPGPIAVHPPTACYRGAGYELMGTPVTYDVERTDGKTGTHPDTFLAADFQKPNATAEDQLRIFWAWSADGNWSAPENPRLTFAGEPALFKLYVTHELSGDGEEITDSAAAEFLALMLPEIRKAVFADTGSD